MNLPFPAPGRQAQVRNWPRRLASIAVAVAVVAVAAATFVLSYSGVRAVAITGGVSVHLAWVYPGVFDAVLVIACVAAILLHDGRWWARAWAWLVLVVLLAAIGGTDVVHAMGYTLRHRPTEGVVAAAPVVAVLVAFSLLLAVLRQSRTAAGATAGHGAGTREPDVAPDVMPDVMPDVVPPIATGAAPRLPAPPIALPAASDATGPEIAATREEPVFGAAPQPSVTAEAPEAFEVFEAPEAPGAPEALDASEPPHAPTEASEVIGPETPSAAGSPRQEPLGIRYASSALDQPGYWAADDDRQFAGQVYPDPRAEAEAGVLGFAHDSENTPAADETVPVTHARHFHRVRSTPTPPNDNDE